MKLVVVRENLSKKKTRGKRRGKLISRNSFTHLFNIQMTKLKIFTDINEILEIIDKSQNKKIGGYAFKITHIAAARSPKLPSSALN